MSLPNSIKMATYLCCFQKVRISSEATLGQLYEHLPNSIWRIQKYKKYSSLASTEFFTGGCTTMQECVCIQENTFIQAYIYSFTSYVFKSLDSRFFQLFDLLLDHKLKGLVVDEAGKFPSAVPLFILLHLPLNPLINCNTKN